MFTFLEKCRCVPKMGFRGSKSRKQVDLVLKCSFLEKSSPDFSVPKIGFGRKIPKSIFCAKSVRRGILVTIHMDLV